MAYGLFIEEVREEEGKCDLHKKLIPIDIPLYASSYKCRHGHKSEQFSPLHAIQLAFSIFV
jgi:hypothetical protein